MKIINGPEVTAKLSAGLKDIARLTGFSERDVTRGEAGQILKTCAGRTKIARPDQVDARTRKRVLHDMDLTKTTQVGGITINTGTRGQAGLVWVRTNGRSGKGRPYRLAGVQGFKGSPFTPTNRHWKDGTWIDINEAVNDSGRMMQRMAPLIKAAGGLARQSWIQIGDAIGIKLENVQGGGISPSALSKARAAIASNGQRYINGTASEQQEKDAGRYFVTLINSLPYWPNIGMDRTLAGVLAGRVGLYKRTFADGAYKSIQSAARNYPWMRTQLAA